MRFVIVTGMSGAGKSTALKMLEDAEYFCVDNLPIPLVEKFAQLTADGTSGEIQKVAVGIDIRSGQALPDLQNILERMSINGICYEILFLDASDDVLVKRYKETRRTHPLAGLGRVDEGIRKERKALEFLKKDADYILDTSQLLTRELKAELRFSQFFKLEFTNYNIFSRKRWFLCAITSPTFLEALAIISNPFF